MICLCGDRFITISMVMPTQAGWRTIRVVVNYGILCYHVPRHPAPRGRSLNTTLITMTVDNTANQRNGYSFGDFWLAYSLMFIFLVIKFWYPGVVFGDLFNFRAVDARNFFALLLTTSAAFLGILVAALLLTFQLIGKEAKRRKEGNILHNRWVISFSCLAAFLVISSICCYVAIPDFKADNDLTLGYYLLYVFIVFLLSIFPLLRVLLHQTNTVAKAQAMIGLLTVDDFAATKDAYYKGKWMAAGELRLSQIRDELLYAIRDNDNTALHTLLTGLTERAIHLITSKTSREDCESVIEGFLIVWKDAEAAASASGGSAFYEIVSNCVVVIYRYAATQKIPLLYFKDLKYYFQDLAENLARKKGIIHLRQVIDTLSISLRIHLQHNCPAENNLQHLLKLFLQPGGAYSSNDEIQWEEVHGFIYDISRIQQLAIDHGLKDLYISARRSLVMLAKYIEHGDYKGLGKYQRAYLLHEIITLGLLFNADKALEAGLFEDTLETYRLDGSLVADIVTNDPVAAPRIFKSIGDHLINARRNFRLNEWMTMNEFGVIPRHTAKQYLANNSVRQATQYVFEVFKVMKSEMEAGQVPAEKKIYDEVKRQLEALVASLKEQEKGGTKIPLITEIEQCLASFQEVNSPPEYNIVPWPKP